MKNIPFYWKASITRCPHCQSMILIDGESNTSKNCAIKDVFEKMNSHYEKCFCKKQSLLKTDIHLMIKSNNGLSTITEWDTNKILI